VDWAISRRRTNAAGVFADEAAAVGGQAHEFQRLPDSLLLLVARQIIEFGEYEQVLIARERTVHGDRLRHIADRAADADRLGGYGETRDPRLPEVGGNRVVSILIVVVLPAPLEPSKPKTSPALTESVRASTAVNVPKRRVRFFISRTMSLIVGFAHMR